MRTLGYRSTIVLRMCVVFVPLTDSLLYRVDMEQVGGLVSKIEHVIKLKFGLLSGWSLCHVLG